MAALTQRLGLHVFDQHAEGELIYEINPNLCTECVGHYDEPQCQQVCPVDCIPGDPDNVENPDELQLKYEKLMAESD